MQRIAERLFEAIEEKAFVLGPSLAPYARLRNRWRYQVMIKAAARVGLGKALRMLRDEYKGPGRLKINIDPVSVM